MSRLIRVSSALKTLQLPHHERCSEALSRRMCSDRLCCQAFRVENAQLWRVLETAAAARVSGGKVRRDAGGSAMQEEAKLRERAAAATQLAASQVQALTACLSEPYPHFQTREGSSGQCQRHACGDHLATTKNVCCLGERPFAAAAVSSAWARACAPSWAA